MHNQLKTETTDKSGLEDYPTPKWATRLFLHHILPDDLSDAVCWEPCANRGAMVDVLRERFDLVIGSDIHDYGAGFPIIDFLTGPTPMQFGQKVDFIVTNPPFTKAELIWRRWYEDMQDVQHLCLMLRLAWLEGSARYDNVHAKLSPVTIAPYTQRVTMYPGGQDRKTGSVIPFAWFVWDREKPRFQRPRVEWIPPQRKRFEREDDYV